MFYEDVDNSDVGRFRDTFPSSTPQATPLVSAPGTSQEALRDRECVRFSDTTHEV